MLPEIDHLIQLDLPEMTAAELLPEGEPFRRPLSGQLQDLPAGDVLGMDHEVFPVHTNPVRPGPGRFTVGLEALLNVNQLQEDFFLDFEKLPFHSGRGMLEVFIR